METNTNAEIQGAKAASRNLSSKLYKLDQESLKQQEIVYNQVLFFQLFIIIIIFQNFKSCISAKKYYLLFKVNFICL